MDKSDHWISLKDAANTVTLCQLCDAIAFNWASKGCAPLGNEHPYFLIWETVSGAMSKSGIDASASHGKRDVAFGFHNFQFQSHAHD